MGAGMERFVAQLALAGAPQTEVSPKVSQVDITRSNRYHNYWNFEGMLA
jgi:hypothetical protein